MWRFWTLFWLIPVSDAVKKCLQLGDSYSSGTGAEPYDAPAQCKRSPDNWGQLYADMVGCEYINRSCNGAEIKHIFEARTFSSNVDIPPQIESVTDDTDYVFMTMGGNDLGFPMVIFLCFVSDQFPQACLEALDDAEAKIEQVGQELEEAVILIQDKLGSNGQVVLFHYPLIVLDVGYTLSDDDVTVEADRRLRDGVNMFNERISLVATATGALVYDRTAQVFAGREAHPSPREINAAGPWIGEQNFHPTTEGYMEWASAIYNDVGEFGF